MLPEPKANQSHFPVSSLFKDAFSIFNIIFTKLHCNPICQIQLSAKFPAGITGSEYPGTVQSCPRGFYKAMVKIGNFRVSNFRWFGFNDV